MKSAQVQVRVFLPTSETVVDVTAVTGNVDGWCVLRRNRGDNIGPKNGMRSTIDFSTVFAGKLDRPANSNAIQVELRGSSPTCMIVHYARPSSGGRHPSRSVFPVSDFRRT